MSWHRPLAGATSINAFADMAFIEIAARTAAEISPLDRDEQTLLALLKRLEFLDYAFVPPTPATHARIVCRPSKAVASSLQDALGWSRPFRSGTIDIQVQELLDEAGMLFWDRGIATSTVRVARLDSHLFLHSAYPTSGKDAVFFGPDSYRFAELIRSELGSASAHTRPRIVDMGTGSGVGAIVAATLLPHAEVLATDVNEQALRFARINAAAAGVAIRDYRADNLEAVPGPIDIVIANPPYLMDDAGRAYRHGGGMNGASVSLDMARMALGRLAPGGRFILYSGSAIVNGDDGLRQALAECARTNRCTIRYRELDPDVFGEELEKPAYQGVDRIALVAAIIDRI